MCKFENLLRAVNTASKNDVASERKTRKNQCTMATARQLERQLEELQEQVVSGRIDISKEVITQILDIEAKIAEARGAKWYESLLGFKWLPGTLPKEPFQTRGF